MFKKLYDKTLVWARHKHAVKYLCGLSFAESSFFPIPPDVMLAPMALATPHKSLRLAFLTTLFSVLGGVFGYFIGFFIFDAITPWLQETRYWAQFIQVEHWFKVWGFWIIFVAGFSFIPYKVFTIAAGALQMAFLPFVLASFIGRGARFFLVAFLMGIGGAKLESKLRQYMDILGWAVIIIIIAGGMYQYMY